MKINRTNCPLFDSGLYIEKVNQTQAKVSMCCYQQLSPDTYDVIDFDANDYLTQLRQVTDRTVEQCKICALDEARGNQSHRQAHILANGSARVEQTKLITLSYNCENTCNLKCLTCGPRYSSKWKPDYKRMGLPFQNFEKQSTHRNKVYQNLDLSQLKFLHFQGGEPMLTNDHVEILTQLRDQNNLENVVVSYNTNGNFLPSEQTLELWRQAKLVKLYFSIDAVNEQYSIIRNPGKWQEVQEVLFHYRDLDLPNIWIEIGVTVSLFNILYIQDIVQWRDDHFARTRAGDDIKIYITFAQNISHGGKVASMNRITESIRKSALQHIASITDATVKDTLLSAVQHTRPVADSKELVSYLDTIDQYQGTDWKQTLSKLYTAINE